MSRRIINFFFKNPKEVTNKEVTYIDKIKDLTLNGNYLSALKTELLSANCENIQITEGEFTTMSRDDSSECCIDVFFEKEYLHMLTIYSDGILLLKNKNKLEKDESGSSYEELDYEEVFRLDIKKSILPAINENNKNNNWIIKL